MRITNQLHFTENHRFCVYRDFSLSGLDYRMLSGIYQPMVGGLAISVYQTLYQQVAGDRTGFSELEQQRKLFLALDLELGDRGRKMLIEMSSKLEAIGLLQSNRKYSPASDDYMYEYVLSGPLTPQEFFKNQHLVMLLHDKVGKYAVLSLREQFYSPEPEEMQHPGLLSEDLSVPFYDIFRLNTQMFDHELEQALQETAPSRETEHQLDVTTKAFHYSDIIQRFPRGTSRNRPFVENLRHNPDQMFDINKIARKFNLSLRETCRLLDEDGMFSEDGRLETDMLQYKANLYFRQDKDREQERERMFHKIAGMAKPDPVEPLEEKPVEMEFYLEVPTLFIGQCNQHQYNLIMRNEPYTRVLERFFPKGSVPKTVSEIFEKIDVNYKMPDEVINVMIHHLHVYKESSWTKNYIDTVASNMMAKGVGSYEQAVAYIREQTLKRKQRNAKTDGKLTPLTGKGRGTRQQKPKIAIISDIPATKPVSEEKLAEIRRLAREIDGKGN
ncbi:DnaD domain protein [Paenibacillus ginsengarvi]|uniref:Helicase DnaB n=1 Tax=Paenibacillus ginsengarvi TaxID=400777 RepID=A0A3B0CKB2_9BACL|nr:DnaD domain protein [Paenibacillus ginsengarvi]RKN85138.1 helicase DnaB [Paenibacillus ginsengarvi]